MNDDDERVEVDPESTENFDFDKVDPALVLKNVTAYMGIKPGLLEGVTTEDACMQLQRFFRSNAEELGDCDICGGQSDVDPDVCSVCPFCGDVDPDDKSDAAEEEEVADEFVEAVPSDDVEVDQEEVSETPSAAPVRGRKKKPKASGKSKSKRSESSAETKPSTSSEVQDKPDEVAEPTPGKVRKSKASTKSKSKSESSKASTAIEKPSDDVVEATDVEVQTEDELNRHIASVKRLHGEGALIMWQMGKHLHAIKSGRLWSLRTAGSGAKTPKYASFEAFVDAEFTFTRQWANRCIQIGTGYTQKQIKDVPLGSLIAILQVKPESRGQLTEMARNGAPTSAIAREVQNHPNRVPLEERRQPGFRAPSSANTSGRPRTTAVNPSSAPETPSKSATKTASASEELTVVLAKPKFKVALNVVAPGGKKKPATSVAASPVGEFKAANGVVMTVRLAKNHAGNLELQFSVKRE